MEHEMEKSAQFSLGHRNRSFRRKCVPNREIGNEVWNREIGNERFTARPSAQAAGVRLGFAEEQAVVARRLLLPWLCAFPAFRRACV